MHPGSGQFGELNVPRDDHLLARRWPTPQTQRRAPVSFMNHAVAHQGIVLAMIHHRQIKHPGIFQSPSHQLIVLDAVAVVGDGHYARSL